MCYAIQFLEGSLRGVDLGVSRDFTIGMGVPASTELLTANDVALSTEIWF